MKKYILAATLACLCSAALAANDQPNPNNVVTAMDNALTTGFNVLHNQGKNYSCMPDHYQYCYGTDHAYENQYYVHVAEALDNGKGAQMTREQVIDILQKYTTVQGYGKPSVSCPSSNGDGPTTWVCSVDFSGKN